MPPPARRWCTGPRRTSASRRRRTRARAGAARRHAWRSAAAAWGPRRPAGRTPTPRRCYTRAVQAMLYDVHGNLPALEAVLADARGAGAERWLLGGDYALFGGWPEDCLALLEGLPDAVWIRGNGERWTANPDDAPDNPVVPGAVQACREALGDALTQELAGLPIDHVDGDTYACHASPVSDLRSFMPEPGDDEAELLEGVTARRPIFGHTHLPFRRERFDGIELVNPGSV